MNKIHHCYTNRHGTYYLRLQIPAQLRQYTAQRELRLSLQTKQPSKAMQRSAAGLSQAQIVFEWIKRKMTEIECPIPPDASDSEQEAIWNNLIEKHLKLKSENPYEDALKELINTAINWIKEHGPEDAETATKLLNNYTEYRLEELGYSIFKQLSKQAVTPEIIAETMMAAATSPAPPLALIPALAAHAPTRSGLTSKICSEAVTEFNRINAKNSAEYISRVAVIQRLMEHIANERTLDQLNSDDWAAIYDRLKYLPKYTTAVNIESKLNSIDDCYRDSITPEPDKHIQRETLTGNQQKLKAICRLAHDREWIRKDFLQHKATDKPTKRDKRTHKYQDLTLDDIKELLSGELYQDIAPITDGRNRFNEWAFWMLPIALYTGMRQKEIAQLHIADIITDQDTNITYFRVHDEGNRSVKSEAGIRNVPIHDQLCEAGFMQFVKARSEQKYLFPELWQLEDGTPTEETQSNRVNKRFNGDKVKTGYFEKCGITEAKKVFHSTRHTVISTLRKNKVDTYYIARIVGHDKDMGITGHYGTGGLPETKKSIDQMDYGEHGALDNINFNTYEKRKPKRAVKRAKSRARRGNH